MIQTMGIVVMLNSECFIFANVSYIFKPVMCEGERLPGVPWPCTRDSPTWCLVWCLLWTSLRIVPNLQRLCFIKLKWAENEVTEGFSEGSSRSQTTAPAAAHPLSLRDPVATVWSEGLLSCVGGSIPVVGNQKRGKSSRWPMEVWGSAWEKSLSASSPL